MTPARLNKKKEDGMEEWILNHSHIFLPLAIIALIVLIILLIAAMTGVSAVESGTYYNHLQDVI